MVGGVSCEVRPRPEELTRVGWEKATCRVKHVLENSDLHTNNYLGWDSEGTIVWGPRSVFDDWFGDSF